MQDMVIQDTMMQDIAMQEEHSKIWSHKIQLMAQVVLNTALAHNCGAAKCSQAAEAWRQLKGASHIPECHSTSLIIGDIFEIERRWATEVELPGGRRCACRLPVKGFGSPCERTIRGDVAFKRHNTNAVIIERADSAASSCIFCGTVDAGTVTSDNLCQ